MTGEITMKDTINDYRKDVALFRFAMISEALHLPPDKVAPYLKQQSEREVTIPGSNRRKVAVTTMRSWIRAYRKAGFDGLMPKRRKDRGSIRKMPGDVVETLLAIRRENMDLSVRQVIVRARATGAVPDDVIIAGSTLHRLFVREGLMEGAFTFLVRQHLCWQSSFGNFRRELRGLFAGFMSTDEQHASALTIIGLQQLGIRGRHGQHHRRGREFQMLHADDIMVALRGRRDPFGCHDFKQHLHVAGREFVALGNGVQNQIFMMRVECRRHVVIQSEFDHG